MIYLEPNKTVYIPRTTSKQGLSLKLENQTTHNITEYNIQVHNRFYYMFNTSMIEFEDGQYTYTITNNNELIESGIAQYGNFEPQNTVQYENEKVTYKTYKYE